MARRSDSFTLPASGNAGTTHTTLAEDVPRSPQRLFRSSSPPARLISGIRTERPYGSHIATHVGRETRADDAAEESPAVHQAGQHGDEEDTRRTAGQSHGGCVVVRVRMWEWGVTRETRSNPVGVSMTEHGAMAALSRALVEAGQPNHGTVAPLVLVDSMRGADYYNRFPPVRIAVYERGVIRWFNPSCPGKAAKTVSVVGRGG